MKKILISIALVAGILFSNNVLSITGDDLTNIAKDIENIIKSIELAFPEVNKLVASGPRVTIFTKCLTKDAIEKGYFEYLDKDKKTVKQTCTNSVVVPFDLVLQVLNLINLRILGSDKNPGVLNSILDMLATVAASDKKILADIENTRKIVGTITKTFNESQKLVEVLKSKVVPAPVKK